MRDDHGDRHTYCRSSNADAASPGNLGCSVGPATFLIPQTSRDRNDPLKTKRKVFTCSFPPFFLIFLSQHYGREGLGRIASYQMGTAVRT